MLIPVKDRWLLCSRRCGHSRSAPSLALCVAKCSLQGFNSGFLTKYSWVYEPVKSALSSLLQWFLSWSSSLQHQLLYYELHRTIGPLYSSTSQVSVYTSGTIMWRTSCLSQVRCHDRPHQRREPSSPISCKAPLQTSNSGELDNI